MAAAAVDNHNAAGTCLDDPNFATICSFIDKFGEACNLGDLPFDYLQEMLENSNEVPPKLAQIHIQLLRRVYKTVAVDKWEKQLAKFGHSYNSQDGWEIERFGYKKAKIQTKLRLLKTLLEAQFDFNVKFKNEVNKLQAEDLRRQPIGRDSEGQLYWYQVDPDANLRIYREDIDDETWEVVASNREEMLQLIEQLSSGVVKRNTIIEEEDDEELSPKEINLDTGKVPEMEENKEDDNNEDEDEEAMQIDESYRLSTEEKAEVGSNISEPEQVKSECSEPDKAQTSDIGMDETSLKLEAEKVTSNLPDGNEVMEVKEEAEPSIAIPNSSNNVSTSPEKVKDQINEENPHLSKNGTKGGRTSDTEVKPGSFNLSLHKDSHHENNQFSSSTNFKEPQLPLPSKTVGEDIWNPAVHEAPKVNVDNHKAMSTSETSSGSKHQHRSSPGRNSANRSLSAKAKSTEFPSEPSPLDNLKMFTQMISTAPNTLSEELRKVTADLEDEGEEDSGVHHRKETDNGEKFLKPEGISVSRKERDSKGSTSKKRENSKTHESTPKLSHDAKKNSTEPVNEAILNQTPETQGIEANVPVECKKPQSSLLDQTENLTPPVPVSTEQISMASVHSDTVQLCTQTTKETEMGVLPSAQILEQVSHIDTQAKEPGSEIAESDGVTSTARSDLPEPSPNKPSIGGVESASEIIVQQESRPAIITESQTPSTVLAEATRVNESLPEIPSLDTNDPPTRTLTASVAPDSESQRNQESVIEPDVVSSALSAVKKVECVQPISETAKNATEASINACTEAAVPEGLTQPRTEIGAEINSDQDNDAIDTKISNTSISSDKNDTAPEFGECDEADNKSSQKPSLEIVEPPITKSTAWLVGYDDSSNDDEASVATQGTKAVESETVADTVEPERPRGGATEVPALDSSLPDEANIVKRKNDIVSEEEIPCPEKKLKINELISSETVNPIVGEVIEEEMMIITGEGSGAELQGGNKRRSSEVTTDEHETADGESAKAKGKGRKKKSEASPAKISAPRRKSFGQELNDLTPTERSVAELNGSSNTERPMRQSRRIAQLREKEEGERRRLEEEQLAQLKQAQLQKQKSDGKEKATKSKGKSKSSQSSKTKTQNYLPSPSVSESESDRDDAYELPKGKGKRGRRGRKADEQKFKKGIKPWLHSSSDEDDEAVEEEEEVHEEEDEVPFDKSDHEFSPESDLGEDDEVCPSRHARTAKIGPDIKDKYATTGCEKCSKGDHPEWILLCDECDKGWHASCLRPQLWVIPEGEWFCPPCQHKKLVEKLGESLIEFDKILKKRESDELRKQRLTYVGISVENILPLEKVEKPAKESQHRSKQSRRRILSDEEDSENVNEFINDNDEDRSSGSKFVSDEESDDEPMYKLRQRKATKAFNFKEYDELMDSALKDDDDEEYDEANDTKVEVIEGKPEADEPEGKSLRPDDQIEVEAEETAPSENTELDEKERKYQELEKASQRKTRRRLNDLDATSDDDSDEDFQDSNADDDEDEEEIPEEDSDWSGDRGADESDESIGRLRRQSKKERKYGRRETYLEVGSVRRSTRRVKPKYQYDESDQEDDDNDGAEPWEEENSEESESNSESGDETWGKKKKNKKPPPPPRNSRSILRNFVMPGSSKGKSTVKKKKKKHAGSDDEDRPWNRGGTRAKKTSDETVQQRTTRGKKINFRDILDQISGESDDDGNIRPKRRRVVAPPESDDSDGPSSSKKLVAELSSSNLKAATADKEHENITKEIIEKESQPVQPTIPKEPHVPASDAVHSNPAAVEILKPVLGEEKPVPAPPYPPVRNQLGEVLKRNSESLPKPPVSQPPSTSLLMSEILAAPPIRTPSPSKKSAPPVGPSPNSLPSGGPPSTVPQPMHRGMSPQHAPSSVSSDISISRGMDPALLQRAQAQAQAIRAFHPAWGRNPLPPPPYGNHHAPGGPSPVPPSLPTSVGKPPPLNSLAFMTQSSRSPYPIPPSLGNPNPNPPPLQSFHQFKRDVGLPMYRFPPNLPGLPPRSGANLLPQMHPGLGQPNPHLEQFYGGPGGSPFGIPGYGIPPHTQSQPMFSPPQHYDYRGEGAFKNEIMVPGGNLGIPPGHGMREDVNSGQGGGEFSGLVSYFSSQAGDDGMDS